MTNLFLKVNKDLFKLGLNPTEILVLAQVMEFQTNTGDCFISDSALAANFGVSESTITRTLKALETKGLIKRETKNTRSGKERHITVNYDQLATSKLTIAADQPSSKMIVGQESNCCLRNKQNDLIKDKERDNKEKDNLCGDNSAIGFASAEVITLADAQEGKKKEFVF